MQQTDGIPIGGNAGPDLVNYYPKPDLLLGLLVHAQTGRITIGLGRFDLVLAIGIVRDCCDRPYQGRTRAVAVKSVNDSREIVVY